MIDEMAAKSYRWMIQAPYFGRGYVILLLKSLGKSKHIGKMQCRRCFFDALSGQQKLSGLGHAQLIPVLDRGNAHGFFKALEKVAIAHIGNVRQLSG